MASEFGILLWKHAHAVRKHKIRTAAGYSAPLLLTGLLYLALNFLSIQINPDCDYVALPLLSGPPQVFLQDAITQMDATYGVNYRCTWDSSSFRRTQNIWATRKKRAIAPAPATNVTEKVASVQPVKQAPVKLESVATTAATTTASKAATVASTTTAKPTTSTTTQQQQQQQQLSTVPKQPSIPSIDIPASQRITSDWIEGLLCGDRDWRISYTDISIVNFLIRGHIFYFPENDQTKKVMSLVAQKLDEYDAIIEVLKDISTDTRRGADSAELASKAFRACFIPTDARIRGFSTLEEAREAAQDVNFKKNVTWGIVNFKDIEAPMMRYSLVAHLGASTATPSLYLQDLVENALIKHKTGLQPMVAAYHKLMPRKCRQDPTVYLAVRGIVAMIIGFSFFVVAAIFVGELVTEHATGLRDFLLICNVSRIKLKLSWFIAGLFFYLPIALLLTGLLRFLPKGLLSHAHPGVLVLLLLTYAFSQLCFAFLLSSMLSRPQWAGVVAGVYYLITYLVAALARLPEIGYLGQDLIKARVLSFFFANVAATIGISYVVEWEAAGEPLTFDLLTKSPVATDGYAGIAEAIAWMLLDSFVYMWLAELNDSRKSANNEQDCLNTISKRRHHLRYLNRAVTPSKADVAERSRQATPDIEVTANQALVPGISLKGLTKQYANANTFAIEQLTVDFYHGQVTSLLGHNGAGKTTTIGILTGLRRQTWGKALITGKDTAKQMTAIRKSLGFCPQHDILYRDMSVKDHLRFFGTLKGLNEEQIYQYSQPLLDAMKLNKAVNTLASQLSGGMKRKLSILIAFLGDPKVILLDEPTSAIDPFSRRAIWDVILSYRSKSTILLSTHYMQEADLISDRIAVISQGRLIASGTPMYLKNKYGNGFRITFAHGDPNPPRAQLLYAIQAFVKGARILKYKATETTVALPSKAVDPLVMADLFTALDREKSALSICSYGISETTLDQVFFKLTKDGLADDAAVSRNNQTVQETALELEGSNVTDDSELSAYDSLESLSSSSSSNKLFTKPQDSVPRKNIKRVSGLALLAHQFLAVIIKRATLARRSIVSLILQLLFPVLCASLMLMVLRVNMSAGLYSIPAKPINIWTRSGAGDGSNGGLFLASISPDDSRFARLFAEALLADSTIAGECLTSSTHGAPECPNRAASQPAEKRLLRLFDRAKYGNVTAAARSQCGCGRVCPDAIPVVPVVPLRSGDQLYGLSDIDKEGDWLLKTDVSNMVAGFSIDPLKAMIPIINTSPKPLIFDRTNFLTSFVIDSMPQITIWGGVARLTAMRKLSMHEPPLAYANLASVNAYNNILLRATIAASAGSSPAYDGSVGIKMEIQEEKLVKNESSMMQFMTSLNMAYFLTFAVTVSSFPALLVVVPERSNGNKDLQLMSGLRKSIYWAGNFVWDSSAYMLSVGLIAGFVGIFREDFGNLNLPMAVLICSAYGLSLIISSYLLTFIFKTARFAVITVFLMQQCMNISSLILLLFYEKPWFEDVRSMLCFVPPFFCSDAILTLIIRQILDANTNFLEWDILGKRFAANGTFTAIVAVILLYKECSFAWLFSLRLPPWPFAASSPVSSYLRTRKLSVMDKSALYETLDVDVRKERQRIFGSNAEASLKQIHPETVPHLVVRDLVKIYHNHSKNIARRKIAVNRVSFAVDQGQCFGLLGVNGAGKSTLFRMLTGLLQPTQGDAQILGKDLHKV